MHEDLTNDGSESESGTSTSSVPLALLWISLASILLSYGASVVSLFRLWSSDLYYHGWIIAGLVAWLAWHERRHLLAGLRQGGMPQMAVVGAGLSVVWLLAFVTHVRILHLTAFALVMTAWAISLFGRPATVLTWMGTFLLALPFWGILVPALRQATVVANGALVALFGIPAEIVDNLIILEWGTFIVADGCSGLNYLMSTLVVAALYAHVLVRSLPRRLAVIGVAALISILGNWVRVFVLVVIGHTSRMQSPMIDDHNWLGWVIFALGLIPFFLLARRIEGGGAGLRDQGTRRSDDMRPSGAPAVRRVLTVTAACIAGPATVYAVDLVPRADEPPPAFVAASEEWQVADPAQRPFSWTPDYQGADEKTEAVFRGPGPSSVVVDRYLYVTQRDGKELITSENRMASPEAVLTSRVVTPTSSEETWFRAAVVRTPDRPVLVWYWFRVGGTRTFSTLYAKLLEIPAFFLRSPPSELVAVSTVCEIDDCSAANAVLTRFMGYQTPD